MVSLIGILNITPDSFSDGGWHFDSENAIKYAQQLFSEGASLVDVGAESTRPGATPLTPAEEWDRLEAVLSSLLTKFNGKISLDTYHPETVSKASEYGSFIVNDVTGLNNPKMVQVVIEKSLRIIICHSPTKTAQEAHSLELAVDSVESVRSDLLGKVEQLVALGFSAENIILDPGIGFGKTMECNSKLLKFAEYVPEFPVMIGYSRKRFLGENRMGIKRNIEAGKLAVDSGAKYLRVHDVAGHRGLLSEETRV